MWNISAPDPRARVPTLHARPRLLTLLTLSTRPLSQQAGQIDLQNPQHLNQFVQQSYSANYGGEIALVPHYQRVQGSPREVGSQQRAQQQSIQSPLRNVSTLQQQSVASPTNPLTYHLQSHGSGHIRKSKAQTQNVHTQQQQSPHQNLMQAYDPAGSGKARAFKKIRSTSLHPQRLVSLATSSREESPSSPYSQKVSVKGGRKVSLPSASQKGSILRKSPKSKIALRRESSINRYSQEKVTPHKKLVQNIVYEKVYIPVLSHEDAPGAQEQDENLNRFGTNYSQSFCSHCIGPKRPFETNSSFLNSRQVLEQKYTMSSQAENNSFREHYAAHNQNAHLPHRAHKRKLQAQKPAWKPSGLPKTHHPVGYDIATAKNIIRDSAEKFFFN